jgi:hypothetical protein
VKGGEGGWVLEPGEGKGGALSRHDSSRASASGPCSGEA